MSKDDSTPPTPGLLSKVVKFVRNPATSWSDLDNKESDRDEALSKQLLKEMIERKRRNDFVRKREFDMLRKMRKREALVGQDPAARPSFFQSSMPSKPDDRAMTLKKIDEIEAQMSMQWWKTKQGVSSTDSISSSSSYPGSRSSDSSMPAGYLPTQQGGLPPRAPVQTAQRPVAPPPAMAPRSAIFSNPNPNPGASAPAIGGLAGVGGSYDVGTSGFSASKLAAIDVGEVAHDAELEEAAIRFANGDDAGAEAGLLEMIAPAGGSRVGHSETWMTLFDLYRATGQQEKFENAALQFVRRFDRSAPQWFSMPLMVQQLAKPGSEPGADAASSSKADWICPSVLGIQTVATLKAALLKAPMPWRLDWSHLKTVEPVAVEPLMRVFAGWSAQPVQLRFIGDAQLQRVLHDATPSGQRGVTQDWWQLRLEALRVTHRPDEFELTALDFCVTYEVSPPAWESARCEYKQIAPQGSPLSGQTIIGEVYRDSVLSSLSPMDGDTQMDVLGSQMGQLFTVELSGQIQGDAISMLETLESRLEGADIMIISCAHLIRVDFSAAGTLLNWVSEREAENRAVQFADVNRLVAAFFNVIGITEHSRVSIRID